MRRLLLLPVLLLPLVLAAPASAVEPTRDEVTLHRVADPFVICPGFAVVGTFDITRETTTYYDQDGTPVKRILYNEITGAVANAVTGYSLPMSGVRIFHIDLVTGDEFTTGSNTLVKAPDGGMVTLGTGLLVFDAAGHLIEHDGPDTTAERAQLCAALGA
jgi:hypothetical protein